MSNTLTITAAGHDPSNYPVIGVVSIVFLFVFGAWVLLGTLSLAPTPTDTAGGKVSVLVAFVLGAAAIGFGIWLGIDTHVLTSLFEGLS